MTTGDEGCGGGVLSLVDGAIAQLDVPLPAAAPGESPLSGPPGSVLVSVSSAGTSCEVPNATLECPSDWRIDVLLTPDDLANRESFTAAAVSTTAIPDASGCLFSTTSEQVVVEFVQVDDTIIEGTICGSIFGLEGSFRATRCGA
jgi:hypothetical protein